ncbi:MULTISPECIES: flagellar export chaperone FlgN [Chromobacterium]|uniref:Flagellar export chaperone FlgN n=2 Tax=Chromobacterium TaxID=535 RepID=A0ABS3GID8_9NEIS|nr:MULTISPECIES: flagellar export chaperone FlgN [Chromobacterium]AXT47438.1 flagellar protein FlgN [Chromobacterium rhizoryzae]MBK0413582.1 flagellar export chaperone FlgN [Chromobacterium haemolyticum]MBO0414684.1 flagellar export chaperone FlgN [Chromobacterium haemolyticum]MBO0497944.1 flagellar export chaperone FlgN [Chromobacterium haemolyticum]OQS32902.1 flagellar protein FlgN [Chromobacterium haemolyticum]
MNREQAFKQLLATVGQDLQGYGRLEQLLEQQFAAALAHQADELRQLGSDIVAQCDALQLSRDQRLQLAGQLLGAGRAASMDAVLKLLPAAAEQACRQRWNALVEQIRLCQTLNLRNGQLLQQQQDLMNRVLNGDSDVYCAQ